MHLEARARDLAELAALDAEEQAEPIAMVAAQLHDGVIEFLEAGNQLIMAIEQQSRVDESGPISPSGYCYLVHLFSLLFPP